VHVGGARSGFDKHLVQPDWGSRSGLSHEVHAANSGLAHVPHVGGAKSGFDKHLVQPDLGSSSELEHAVHLGGAKSGLAHAVQLGNASPFRHLVQLDAGSHNGLEHLLEHLCLYVLLTTPGISVHHSVLFFGSENQPAGQLLFVLSVV